MSIRRLFTRGRVIAVIFMAFVGSMLVSTPAHAVVDNLRMTISPSSGREGIYPVLTSVDPCPVAPGGIGGDVHIQWAQDPDGAGAGGTLGWGPTSTPHQWQNIARADMKKGTVNQFTATCDYQDANGVDQTIASYAPVTFTSTDEAAHVDLSSKAVPLHGKLVVSNMSSSSVPCLAAGQNVIIGVYPNDSENPDYTVVRGNVTNADGMFMIEADLGSLRAGSYFVTSECYSYLGQAPDFNMQPSLDYAVENITVSSSPVGTYVAMGDSYSSGEGVPDFIPPSDTSRDQCHRSYRAYPEQVAGLLGWPSARYKFVACSGATTKDMTKGMYKEASQFSALDGTTTFVTLTIGGNDVHFSDVVHDCITSKKLSCKKTWDAKVTKDIANVRGSLRATYKKILDRAPNAEVRVLLYPRMFSHDPGLLCNGITADEAMWINEKTSDLDNQIIAQIKDLKSTPGLNRITWVNTYVAFDGGEMCVGGGDGWGPVTGVTDVPIYMNGVLLFHQVYSFHPTAAGQNQLAQAVIKQG